MFCLNGSDTNVREEEVTIIKTGGDKGLDEHCSCEDTAIRSELKNVCEKVVKFSHCVGEWKKRVNDP